MHTKYHSKVPAPATISRSKKQPGVTHTRPTSVQALSFPHGGQMLPMTPDTFHHCLQNNEGRDRRHTVPDRVSTKEPTI